MNFRYLGMEIDYMAVDWIGIIFTTLSVAVTLLYSYYVYFGIIGFNKHRPSPEARPEKSIAIMLPAYREESVVGETIRNLKELDYPKELYDIYVVIDTPDDMTGPAAEKELDCGIPIIEKTIPILPSDDLDSLMSRAFSEYYSMMRETVDIRAG
jgi:cellulose synthase/poly-beta-1,6-N-acetylglucosamine synthase-like glycosyltransferase